MSLEVKNLTKSFEGRKVLDDISFKVDNGQTLGVVGFSGSGKSTLLKIISGILEKDAGSITYPENSEIAMSFQYSALFDFLDIYDNIAFPLVERKEFRGKYTNKEIKPYINNDNSFIFVLNTIVFISNKIYLNIFSILLILNLENINFSSSSKSGILFIFSLLNLIFW